MTQSIHIPITENKKVHHHEFSKPVSVKVFGDFACFTRPETKVERISYDVMTASAARGILESIYWHPEFEWLVDEIQILKPIRKIAIRRNEVKFGFNLNPIINAYGKLHKSRRTKHITIKAPNLDLDNNANRVRRHTLFLKDVSYIIVARARYLGGCHHIHTHADIFRKRVLKGSSFSVPYLGTRECLASFEPPIGDEKPISTSFPLGLMFRDFEYSKNGVTPIFEPMQVVNGVVSFSNPH